jgi:hypothetical protein
MTESPLAQLNNENETDYQLQISLVRIDTVVRAEAMPIES